MNIAVMHQNPTEFIQSSSQSSSSSSQYNSSSSPTSSLFSHEHNVHISLHLSQALTQQQLASQARLHEHANNSKTSSGAGLDPSQVNATSLCLAETFQRWLSDVGTAGLFTKAFQQQHNNNAG